MKLPWHIVRPLVVTACLLALAGILSGCAATDPDNNSARPWNAPKTWETGMPAGMMEGR